MDNEVFDGVGCLIVSIQKNVVFSVSFQACCRWIRMLKMVDASLFGGGQTMIALEL